MKNIHQIIGRKIRATRKRLKLTQAELSEKADICINFIGHIERGTKKASLETILKIANSLDIHISELFDKSELYTPRGEDLFSKQISFLLRDKKPSEKKNILKIIKLISRKK